jgi:hypothetical protein
MAKQFERSIIPEKKRFARGDGIDDFASNFSRGLTLRPLNQFAEAPTGILREKRT